VSSSMERLSSVTWHDQYSAVANLSISATVVAYGIYWLRRSNLASPLAFRYRAYIYWWLSWVAWVIAWFILTGKEFKFLPSDSVAVDAISLLPDNLNTVFLVMMYFILTRGNEYSGRWPLAHFGKLLVSLVVAYALLYAFLGVASDNLGLAYQTHKAWSLCLQVFAPILVGWSFNLRFNTRVVLIVGFIYGFLQPLVYATQLEAGRTEELAQKIKDLKPVIGMVLAFLKVLWAIACTKVLSSAYSTDRNLVRPDRAREYYRVSRGWTKRVALHAVIVLGVYLVLVLFAAVKYAQDETWGELMLPLSIGFTVVNGFIGLMYVLWEFWRNVQ